MRYVPDHIVKPDYFYTSVPNKEMQAKLYRFVEVKSEKEIENMREACLIARKALDLGHSKVKPGVTTDYIDGVVHDYIVKNNAYPSPLNYHSFPKSICTYIFF
jgi:methionyl aminopeptidase